MRYLLYIMVGMFILVLFVPFLSHQLISEPQLPDQLDVDCTITIYDSQIEKYYELSLGEYLVCVLAAEMPVSFEMEALKAQAVAARTYVYKRIKRFGGSGCKTHPDADICSDYFCCQAYHSIAHLKKIWQGSYDAYRLKIAQAIAETAGQIITYQGRPIDPVYHSTCGGKTESARNVWGNDIAYLQSVTCSYCTESPRYIEDKKLSIKTFASSLSQQDGRVPALAMQASVPEMHLNKLTDSGRVESIKIGNVIYSGTQVRSALNLNSTNFSWNINGEAIVIKTQGYGHGVGMCQYGANGMAKAGFSYAQIIKHYYQNTKIERIK